ncbi:LysM peptidoglycan-binding domain-containing protein [Rhodococcus rhodochrous]|uniref:LysM peptidoglycan-binding domain-containing protein n=1 Tax=Rhodococcus rhodochrous TaxID=1829 RepID=UPI001E651176|nr:LysM peptidoglycan-binding domain-containing protein [Rhodococcus rhodochrous]MCD2100046.1 LysM peptidoglycan-binding domain-containing protein [Rhodococcus rhodochrous]MCD2124420.1 LysM peptidoglycan-binding domain-containing protein [Rhodococcus rhodochrous]MCQ4137286.1 LysM peptidoglycan-binding domain-containing protein [Rhodococcus rhodochrous]MDJ0021110.1 LysM peptidoglycan-binding domain-containing protein [Rhodococcus rhodochrous]
MILADSIRIDDPPHHRGTVMVTKYEVVAGDTLSKLAQWFYGDATLYPVIAVPNGIVDPDDITVGQELLIPYITDRHTVAPGETLSGLAQHFYGDGTLFPVLAAANHITDPNVVRVGRSLLVPELGDVGHHTVVTGETLSGLARRWYGEAQLYPVISFPNHITDPDHVEVGRVLIRPGLNYRHTVVAGDTLRALAEDHYGNAEMFAMIAAANHIADPDRITVGQVLFFPNLTDF